jgi:1-acyl-sn-glycerol-3-phosphate acyltransferase
VAPNQKDLQKIVRRWIARKLLTILGWKIEGERPPYERYVLIAAPHTSNWDFPLMLAFAAAFDIKVSWMAKHNLFFPPMGWIMHGLGGIPIRRHKKGNMVISMIDTFKQVDSLVLVVPTEGTRARTDYWKSGFYHIAHGAGIPIVPSYLDYANKRGGFGPALMTTGDINSDMPYFREFYAPMRGRTPELFGPIRLREESDE